MVVIKLFDLRLCSCLVVCLIDYAIAYAIAYVIAYAIAYIPVYSIVISVYAIPHLPSFHEILLFIISQA